MKKHSKLKKVLIWIAAILGIVFVLAMVAYINIKSFTVKRVQTAEGEDVYLMGTFHTDHFDSVVNYSIEEMLVELQNYIQVELLEVIDKYRKEHLQAMLEDAKGWTQQDIDIEDYEVID